MTPERSQRAMRRRTPRRFQYFMRNSARSFQESSSRDSTARGQQPLTAFGLADSFGQRAQAPVALVRSGDALAVRL